MHLAAHGLTSLGTDPYQNLSKSIGTNGLKIRVQPTTISTINKHVLSGSYISMQKFDVGDEM